MKEIPNSETQNYINDALLFMKNNNNFELSFLLAMLDTTDVINNVFQKYGITFSNYNKKDLNKFKISNIHMSQIKLLLKEISCSIKNEFNIQDENFNICDIMPYQILDHLMYLYNKEYEKIFIEVFNLDNESYCKLMTELDEIIGNRLDELALNYGYKSPINETNEMQSTYIPTIKLGNVSTAFNSNLNNLIFIIDNMDDMDIKDSNGNLVELTKLFLVEEINNKKVDKHIYNDFIGTFNDTESWTFKIINDCKKEFEFNVTKEKLFKIDNVVIKTEALSKFAHNLTEDKYSEDPCVGRDDEIKKIMQVLLYPERDKSIIVTGPCGSGKTSLIKSLAYKIQNKQVPKELENLQIYSIDFSQISSGDELIKLLDEASSFKNVILFIDNIHLAVPEYNYANSMAEVLKNYIENNNIRIIGTTSTDKYLEYFEYNEEFKSIFKRISIKEPSIDSMYSIINNLISKYNQISNSKFNFSGNEKITIINVLIEVTKDTSRVFDDKLNNPRLIMDILKYSYAIAQFNNHDEVTINDICEAILNEERIYDGAKYKCVQKLKCMNNNKSNNLDNKVIELKFYKEFKY